MHDNLMASDAVAVVTGGATGIGFATAKRLLQRGSRVLICGRDTEAVNLAVERLQPAQAAEGCVVGLSADLEEAGQPVRVIDECVSHFGGIHILVNNAGILSEVALTQMSAEAWDKTLNINLRAAALASGAAVKRMIAQGTGGRVVHVASVNAVIAEPGFSHYGASKAGLVSLAQYMAVEYARHGIVTNAVAPGWVRTRMTEAVLDSLDDVRSAGLNPSGRAASPDEIAAVIEFLCFDSPAFLVGQTIVVDGGQTIMLSIP
jgi:3-oxoacyl-[acyl-carrier protein] reductase